MIYEKAADDVSGKDPVHVAAIALCVADELAEAGLGEGGYSSSQTRASACLPPRR